MPTLLPYFTTKLDFQDNGGLPFVLTAPLTYVSVVRGKPWTISVPAGFKTDLASIPRALWVALPPVGKYDAAAVLHDYLYQTDGAASSRSEADAVLREAMEVLDVGRVVRWLVYSGVRVGGGPIWNRYRND